jgi:hypothetical protein
MPQVSPDIAWSSHVLMEHGGKVGLYHYECGNADIVSFYKMFVELTGVELVEVEEE